MMRKVLATVSMAAVVVAVSPAYALGIGHSFFMRGEVVRVDSGGAVVCLGRLDGAHQGQVLEVYRQAHRYRKLVGHVEVDQIFDEHFAHVHIVEGDLKKSYWFILQRHHNSTTDKSPKSQ